MRVRSMQLVSNVVLLSEEVIDGDQYQFLPLDIVKEKFESLPCGVVRIKPRDDHPILNHATRNFLSDIYQHNYETHQYPQQKYEYLNSIEEDFYHPSCAVVQRTEEAPMYFEPGSVKAFVQYKKNKGYFDIWDRHKRYEDDWLNFDEWISEYKYGGNRETKGYKITNPNDVSCIRLSPIWDRSELYKSIELKNENEFSKSKG